MLGRKLFSSGLVLGLVVSCCFPARADLLKNFKTDGSIETRSFGIDNETDQDGNTDDYRGETRTRVMLGASSDLLDDVHARVLLRKNNRLQGQAVENVNSVETALAIDNAYVKVDKVMDRVDLTIGRQFYGNADDLVIYFGTQNDDYLSVTSADLFRADADLMGWAKFEGIAGKTVESTPISATAPPTATNINSDTDLFGIKLMNDKLIPKGGIGLSYYTLKAKGAGTAANNTLNVLDLCLLGDVPVLSGLGYHADVIMNGGRNGAPGAGNAWHSGDAFYVGLKYGHDLNSRPIRAAAEWGKGSKNFQGVASGKRFGIIWGEHTNAVGNPSSQAGGIATTSLSNLNVMDASVGVSPISKLGIDVSWFRFQKSDKLSGSGAGLSSLGTEYDLVVSWKHSENVSLEANAASFQVGDALQNTAPTGTKPITRLGADVKIKF